MASTVSYTMARCITTVGTPTASTGTPRLSFVECADDCRPRQSGMDSVSRVAEWLFKTPEARAASASAAIQKMPGFVSRIRFFQNLCCLHTGLNCQDSGAIPLNTGRPCALQNSSPYSPYRCRVICLDFETFGPNASGGHILVSETHRQNFQF